MKSLLPLALVLVLIVGCGESGGGEAAGDATTEEATTTAEAETTTDTAGGTTATATEETTPTTTEDRESVEDFIVRVAEYTEKGQYGRVYELLHPAQKKLMTANDLADCLDETRGQLGGDVTYKIEEVYDEPWDIAGTKLRTQPSKAVTVTIQYTQGDEQILIETFTQHVVNVDGEWRWIASPDVVEALKTGVC